MRSSCCGGSLSCVLHRVLLLCWLGLSLALACCVGQSCAPLACVIMLARCRHCCSSAASSTAAACSSSSPCGSSSTQQACGPLGRALWGPCPASSTHASGSRRRCCCCLRCRHVWACSSSASIIWPAAACSSSSGRVGPRQWLHGILWQLRPAWWAHGVCRFRRDRLHVCTLLELSAGLARAAPCGQHRQHLLSRLR